MHTVLGVTFFLFYTSITQSTQTMTANSRHIKGSSHMMRAGEQLCPCCLVCQEVMGASGCPIGAEKGSYAQEKLLLPSWLPHLSPSSHFTQQLEQTRSPFSQRSCLDLLSSFSFSPSASPWSSTLIPLRIVLHEMAFACDCWHDLKSKAIVPLTLEIGRAHV